VHGYTHRMRIPIILAGLLLVSWSGCGPSTRGKAGPVAGPPPRVDIPGAVTEKNYEPLRDQYDALELETLGRAPYRQLLLTHLLNRIDGLLARHEDSEALDLFKSCLTLFDPVEVYGGLLPGHERLARTADRLVRIFSPQGDERKVLLPLCVQISLSPSDRRLTHAFQQITSWLRDTGELMGGQSRRWLRTVQVLESVVKLWPSTLVIETLRKAYIEQRLSISRAFQIGPTSHLRGAISALFQTGFKVARNYLLVDRMAEALQRLQEVASERTPDEELRLLLERATEKNAGPDHLIRLSDFFEERDREVALRICRQALHRFPNVARIHGCVGRLAASLRRTTLSIKNLEPAVRLEPSSRGYVELLAQQYQRRLFSLIGDEKLDQARGELSRIEVFYRRHGSRFKTPIEPPLSRVYDAIGQGFYNAGHVDAAASALDRSIAITPSPEAMVQLATIRLKQRRPDAAEPYLQRAEKLSMPSAHARAYWQGRIEFVRGQALEVAGNHEASRNAHRQAIDAWQSYQALGLEPEDKAEAYTFEARSLFAIDQRARGMDALDRAVDVLPDRKETYADVIALLATHGHLPEALDAYHRALGRREVSEYLKSYCSFWIIGLARRANLPPDPLAMSHLARLRGAVWYTELARLIRGQATFDELLTRARGPSNLAELYFYQADLLLATGKLKDAQALWNKVLATNMMAFYEFDMATYNLAHGPARVHTEPLDRQQSAPRRTSADNSPSNQP